jgi:hypothetical protein
LRIRSENDDERTANEAAAFEYLQRAIAKNSYWRSRAIHLRDDDFFALQVKKKFKELVGMPVEGDPQARGGDEAGNQSNPEEIETETLSPATV